MPVSPTEIVAALRRLRCSPAEVAALAMLASGAVLALGLLWHVGRPSVPLPGAAPRPTEGSTSDPSGLGVTAAEVVVHVAGAVRRAGVYTLPGGSRVGDALEAAGGARRRAVLDGLNLARVLADGEQVLVASRGDADAEGAQGSGSGSPAAPTTAPTRISLNQATAADLETLPNIGPVLAQRIIDHRQSIGGFTDVGQLRDVPGIGEKTFQALAELVSL